MARRSEGEPLDITREYAAPRALVFEAWTKAEHMEKWMGPDGFTVTCTVDFRVGGAMTMTMSMDGHGLRHTVRGTYVEIVPLEKIVQRMRFDDLPDQELTMTVTFTERGGKTSMHVRQDFPSLDAMPAADRELWIQRMTGAPVGWSQALANLARLVES